MMKIATRSLTKKDLKKIGSLIIEEFNKPPYKDGWTEKTISKTLANYFKIGYGFVAVVDRRIVGAVIVRDEPYAKGRYIAIEELVVKKEFHKRGVGKALIKQVETIARKKKVHTIYLYTNKKSEAFRFYAKLGYKESKNMRTLGKVFK